MAKRYIITWIDDNGYHGNDMVYALDQSSARNIFAYTHPNRTISGCYETKSKSDGSIAP